MGLPNYAKVETYEKLLKIEGVHKFDGGRDPYTDRYNNHVLLDIPESKWYYLRVNSDGTIDPCEYDPGEPTASYFPYGIDVFLERIPKETAKGLCFHLDLFKKR